MNGNTHFWLSVVRTEWRLINSNFQTKMTNKNELQNVLLELNEVWLSRGVIVVASWVEVLWSSGHSNCLSITIWINQQRWSKKSVWCNFFRRNEDLNSTFIVSTESSINADIQIGCLVIYHDLIRTWSVGIDSRIW